MGFLSGLLGTSNSFQAKPATTQTSNYGDAIKMAMANQPGVFGQQQQLATQLQGQAAGTGPSIAQPMLQQATEQNNNLSAGAIASLRGINPGLAARQILQQRAANQQSAALQGALLRNQEQLGAQGMLGNVLGTMGQQNLGQLGVAGGLQNQQNATEVQNQLGTQQINAGVQGQNAGINAGLVGGVIGGASSVLAAGGGGGGGGKFISGSLAGSRGMMVPGKAAVAGDSGRNDTVSAKLSPGEIVIPRSIAQSADAPEKAASFVRAIQKKHRMSQGGEVPSYGSVIQAHKKLEARVKALEGRK